MLGLLGMVGPCGDTIACKVSWEVPSPWFPKEACCVSGDICPKILPGGTHALAKASQSKWHFRARAKERRGNGPGHSQMGSLCRCTLSWGKE